MIRRRRTMAKFFFISALLAGLIFLFFGFLNSKMFEKNLPQIDVADRIFWNGKDKVKINLQDDSGIKSVKIFIANDQENREIYSQNFSDIQKNLMLELELPKEIFLLKSSGNALVFEACDVSKNNFFSGNKITKKVQVIYDNERPEINVLNQSYKITKGGSAIVIFSAKDVGLKEVYIQTNFGKTFIPVPFYKESYFASLVAWPVSVDNFEASIVAKDLAGNERKTHIRFYLQDRKYRESKLTLKDDFIDGKITDLYENYNPGSTDTGVAKFKWVNEILRGQNDNFIKETTSKVSDKMIDDFTIEPFYPLRNGAAVASFGDHRFYEKDGLVVSESWHMGLDLASVENADIIAKHSAVVAGLKENGIYGLNLILDHGFGLYSLYGHCSASNLRLGDIVKPGDIIANTGKSGLAFGDHLHFGILVQGVEVRPEEWMDKKWLNDNIYEIVKSAKKVMDNAKH